MKTKRQIIEDFRKELSEVGADSTYANQFLYNSLMKQAQWLIRREISAGRIYRNTSFFQTLSCQKVIEVPITDACCPVKTNCTIYRTKDKLPETWIDNNGPIIKSITSVDGSTDFFVISASDWQNKSNDPYEAMLDEKYTFFADGYFWFPKHNPNRINIFGFFTDDITEFNDCSANKECIRQLDTKFMIPDWLEAEMFAKAKQLLVITKQLPEDTQIDKNQNRRN